MVNFKDKKVMALIGIVLVAVLVLSGSLPSLMLVSTDSFTYTNGYLESKLDIDKTTYEQAEDGTITVGLEKLSLKNTAPRSLFSPKIVMVQIKTIEIYKSSDPKTPLQTVYVSQETNINPIVKGDIEIKPQETKVLNYIFKIKFDIQHDSFFIRINSAVFGSGGVGAIVPIGQDAGNVILLPDVVPDPVILPNPPIPDPIIIPPTPTPVPDPVPTPVPTPLPDPTPDPTKTYEMIERESSSKLKITDLQTNISTILDGTLTYDENLITVYGLGADGEDAVIFDTSTATLTNGYYKFTDTGGNVVYIPEESSDISLLFWIAVIGAIASFVIIVLPQIPTRGKIFLLAFVWALIGIFYIM